MSAARSPRENHYGPRGGSDAATRSFDSSVHVSSARIAFAVIAILGLMWIGWRIIVSTAAYNLAIADPELAVAWMPEAGALDALAFREFTKTDGDLDIARSLAERALQLNPLDARALSALGLIAERKGNRARADVLMRLSGTRTWRDSTTQAWLVNQNIQRGEFEQALSNIDALLRVNREVMEQTFPVLAAFTIDKRTFDILANFLADDPPWRASFLINLSGQISDTGRLMQLFAALRDSPHPPDSSELGSYLDRLIKDGKFAEAYRGWRETLSPQNRASEVYPYNGNFTAPIDGLPFNWLLRPASGVDIQVLAAPGKTDSRILQLQFSGARVAAFTVGQLMVLPSGQYRLTGMVRAEGLRTQRGLRWHIFCGTSPNGSLALTNLVANSVPWTNFSVDFVVPKENCPAQWLKLELPDRTASERQIEGQIWYENIQITQSAKGFTPGSQ